MIDHIRDDEFVPDGRDNTFSAVNDGGTSHDGIDAAVAELRGFIARLAADGMVAPNGTVTDPGGVVEAVRAQPGRLPALARVVAAGAKDTVLAVVDDGVAALVVDLLGPSR